MMTCFPKGAYKGLQRKYLLGRQTRLAQNQIQRAGGKKGLGERALRSGHYRKVVL